MKMKVTEMSMPKWKYDVTRLYRIRNEHIKGSLQVTNITGKIRENRLRSFVDMLRKVNNDQIVMAGEIKVEKTRKNGD